MIYLSEHQVREIARCAASPEYFVEHYAWLEQKETQEILPFKPFPYQRKMLRWMKDGRNVLALKSRRVGCSWLTAAYAAWLINFHKGVNVLFLSKKEADAKNLLRKVKFILKNLAEHDYEDHAFCTKADWLCGEIYTDTQLLFTIAWRDDRGRIVAESEAASLSTTSESGRSEGASLIFLDEFAFIKPDDEKTWTAIKPTVARGGQWVICSTPNGVGGVFHRMCMEAQRHENKSYEYLEVHWSEAGIDQEMYESAIEGMDSQSIAQEWEMDFAQSGNPVFSATDLAACYKPPDEYPEVAGALENYRKSVGAYYSGVDTAVGKVHRKSRQKDYSSWISLTKTGIQAYAYHSKEPLSRWAGLLTHTASGTPLITPGLTTEFHNKFPGVLKVEQNGPGDTVLSMHQLPRDGQSDIVPAHTDSPTKSRLINNLKVAIESHLLTLTDLFTYQCMLVYQHGAAVGQYEAPSGYFDDPCIALALAYDLMLEFGNMEFTWADGKAPQRASVSAEAMEEASLTLAGVGPGFQLENVRASEWMPGPGLKPPGLPSYLPDLSPTLDYEHGEPRRLKRERNKNLPAP